MAAANLPSLTVQTSANALVLGSSNASVPLSLTGIYFVPSSTAAGTILLIDGSSAGTQRVKLNTPVGTAPGFVSFANGVTFNTGVYVEMSPVKACTLVYRTG